MDVGLAGSGCRIFRVAVGLSRNNAKEREALTAPIQAGGCVPSHYQHLAITGGAAQDRQSGHLRAASQASKAAEWLLARHAEYRLSKAGEG
jgi:hypothetical protein